MRSGLTGLAILLAVAVPALGQAEGDCVVSAKSGQSVRAAQGVLGLEPELSEMRNRVRFDCRNGRVAHVRMLLIHGQATEARMRIAGAGGAPEFLTEEGGGPEPWLRLEASSVEGVHDSLLTLRAAAPESVKPGSTLSGRLQFPASGATESRPGIEVTLEVVESEPLFQDEFGVDPVIGQFSLAP